MNQCEYLYTHESLASKETLHDDALAAERSSGIFFTVTRPLSPTYRIRSLLIILAVCERKKGVSFLGPAFISSLGPGGLAASGALLLYL